MINLIALPCPECSQKGQLVRILTVRSLLKRELRNRVKNIAYYLCMNSDCVVSYYCNDPSDFFTINDVKVPIWFKKDAHPRYACYCNKITPDEVIDAVIETGLTKISEVTAHLRDNVKCACVAMNPSGRCCTPLYSEAIEIGLKKQLKK